jgi:hypothetical protein
MTSSSTVTAKTLVWRGTLIQIHYETEWLGGLTAYFTIKALEPARAALPITDAGYRSHFIDGEIVEDAGGPAAYVDAWLERAATRRWKIEADAARQYSLL